MSLSHLVMSSSPHCCCFSGGNGGLDGGRRVPARADAASVAGKVDAAALTEAKSRCFRTHIAGLAVSKVAEVNTVENGQISSTVEIPVTCYQILGVSEKAEKDEIVKAAMELKNSEIEEGYTTEVPASRQDLLMDVRDKLLFEPEYVGNKKENVPPRSLVIPWNWLPAALCLLQEVGESKLVLEIGRIAMHRIDSKLYVHDILLSLALAECSIAKIGFEKNKVSEGFEALARAQYLLRSKISLGKLPLLAQIEESLEELAPACTLELLSIPHTLENAERRRGAIAALRELLRQGLDVESSCRVQDWPCFLNQALNWLTSNEIVELLSWDTLAETRKNRKSLESQNQRAVVDFDCFYLAMVAHIAFGFSTRQREMIGKAKTICESLFASESVDLKFEESLCLFLLGQESAAVAYEKLCQLEANGSSNSQTEKLGLSKIKGEKGKDSIDRSLELWLKDSALSLFPDTHDCSPSLANFFTGPKRTLTNSKLKLGQTKFPSSSHNILPNNRAGEQNTRSSSIKHLGEAVKQLAPSSLDVQSTLDKSASHSTGHTPVPLKRNPDPHNHMKNWQSGDLAQKLAYSAILGYILFAAFKLLSSQFGRTRLTVTHNSLPAKHAKQNPSFINSNVWNRLGKVSAILSLNSNKPYSRNNGSLKNVWPTSGLSMIYKRNMDLEEAAELVKQWQEIKADALGPTHQIGALSLVLDESMLSKWEELACSAKAQSCFWKFVLLKLSVLRAEIISDDSGSETAEIEALLEEAAELVDEAQPKKPSYYSTYKVQYTLKRHGDRSWRICDGDVQTVE